MYRTIIFFLFMVFLIDDINSLVAHCETKTPNNCRQHFHKFNRSVEIGDVIIICVKTLPNANVLILNLQESEDVHKTTPLHLSFRFSQNIILRSSKLDGKWGTSDKTENLYSNVNPLADLKPGEAFTVQILVGGLKYYISINGKSFAKYTRKIPLSKIHGVMAYRDLDIVTNVEHISTFPKMSSNCNAECVNENFVNSAAYPIKLIPGNIISLTGIVTDAEQRFSVQFRETSSGRIFFEFNPRFPQNHIIRNSMDTHFKWLAEETDGPFPFVMNQYFKLTFGFYANEVRFAVDGIDLGTFQYRDDDLLDKVNELHIFSEYGLNFYIREFDVINSGSTNLENIAFYSKIDGKKQ